MEDDTGGELGGSPLLLEPPPPVGSPDVGDEGGGLDGGLLGDDGSLDFVGDDGGGSLRGVVVGLTVLPPVGCCPGLPG